MENNYVKPSFSPQIQQHIKKSDFDSYLYEKGKEIKVDKTENKKIVDDETLHT